MKVRKIVRMLVLSLCLLVLFISAYHVIDYWHKGKIAKSLNDSIRDKVVSTAAESQPGTVPITVDFEILQSENEDIVGWLYCSDTEINYPVVQSRDNNYYLHRLFDGTWNMTGTLFADFRNAGDFSDRHTVIYGHNMKNKSMFGTLPEYRSQEYYEQHPVWYLLTPTQNYKIELCAGYVTPADSEIYNLENSKEERERILETALEQSCFKANVSVSGQDNLITLSTCSYEFENARFALTGRLLPIK